MYQMKPSAVKQEYRLFYNEECVSLFSGDKMVENSIYQLCHFL